MLVGLRFVLSPFGELEEVKKTVPEKPFRLVTLMLDVAEEPWVIVRLEGFAEMENEPWEPVTVTETTMEWVVVPLLPVTVTAYEPGGVEVEVETVRTEVAEPPGGRETKLGLTVAAMVVDETVSVRVTVPENPLRLVRTMVEDTDEPAATVRFAGFVEIAKSGLG